jgi:hypothetical protein
MKKPKTIEEVFAIIDNFIVESDPKTAKDLWAILTALRGPDNGDNKSKDLTTALIRAKVVPLASDCVGAICHDHDLWEDAGKRRVDAIELSYNQINGIPHFFTHAKWAFEALNLKWNTNNK